ncbi:MAG: Serine/threonine protein kinase PrkC, regulator of stationary phase [Myxococcaceae bacterium]|nr:Serine/threonine protein kinase PrkC, regulator of stationary phase [Myxococcaceae bacterium]
MTPGGRGSIPKVGVAQTSIPRTGRLGSEVPQPMLSRIGNCQILEEIGSGGMATVYRATQQPLGRVVAIKALKPSIAVDSQFAKRFEREAHFMASLQHENILHVHDFLKQEGSMFIVMEYVKGIDLFDLLEKRRMLPTDVAAIIALNVARALDYAHFRGIIHRDVKPANVMISRQGEVKLMDFGIARDDSQRDLTETGTGLGTPSYMSPEQILGDKLDFRSDIFSLGIVLYQMLTGQKPFIEDDSHTVMQKIRLDRYISPRKLNPSVPRRLEHIIARCMEKLPANRYGSTQAVIDELIEFLASRVPINHSARLVMFLRELAVISDAEADEILEAGGSRGTKKRDQDRTLLRHSAISMGAVCAGLVLSGAAIQAVARSTDPTHSTVLTPLLSTVDADDVGYLQLVVDPWAEVYADGKLIAVTPTAERVPLRAGRHFLKFVHPHFGQSSREITVKQGRVEHIEVRLLDRPAGGEDTREEASDPKRDPTKATRATP